MVRRNSATTWTPPDPNKFANEAKLDPESLPLIDGTIVDFVKQGLNEAFKFQNPKARVECGCGESFSV